MLAIFRPGTSLAWDLLWQSSLFLAIGLAASAFLRRHPARAHRVLILTLLAALLTPIVAQAVRMRGWGVLETTTAAGPTETAVREGDIVRVPVVPPSQQLAPGREAFVPGAGYPGRTLERPADGPTNPPAPADSRSVRFTGFSWGRPALFAWAVLCSLALLRLVSSFFHGFRLVRRTMRVDDARLSQAAARAASRLGLRFDPELRSSRAIRCPSVWCWGRRPILLVPGQNAEQESIDWIAVFCHELAHWRRLDHISSLAAQLLVCVLPWNPLAWWTKARLAQLAELACDDWVLASGLEGADYAASLLVLLPQRGTTPALAAVSSRGGLVGRVKHILGDRRSSPTIGSSWALLALACTMLAAGAVALAQQGPASSPEPETAPADSTLASTANSPRQESAPMKRSLHVTVTGLDGKPVAHASVVWAATKKPSLQRSALPHDHRERMRTEYMALARAQTDEQGRAKLPAEFDPDSFLGTMLIVTAPGFGLHSHILNEAPGGSEIKISLAPEVVIHGRLLAPSGTPATGVRVLITGYHNDMKRDEGMFAGLAETDDELPFFWPRPVQSGTDGRFIIEGVPQEVYATLSFWHPEFAVDEVTVNTIAAGTISPGLKGFEIVPVKPNFTHTLEPSRPVQGRVTDKSTGKPLAGMLVEMTPMRRHGGMPFEGRTDADGRYRISGHATDFMYYVSVFPKADSGYLSASETRQGWPAGARSLEVNVALDKGMLIQGTVVDQSTRTPIAGAAVMYQPAEKNPNNKNGYDLRNTILTDHQGKFTITGLPGDGMLVVEASDRDAIRSPVTGTMYGKTAYPHGTVAVNISQGAEPKPVEITVRKGVTIEAKAMDPDGRPVRDLMAFYPGISACLIDVWNQGQEFPDGVVRIRGADPARTYRVFMIKPDQRLGVVAELKYDPRAGKPIEVRLQPTATIRGKVATPSGSIAQGCQVYASLLLDQARKQLSHRELFNEDLAEIYANILGMRNMHHLDEKSGNTGEFTLEAMIPGASYYITAAEAGNRAAQVPVPDLKAGEVRDLGTLVLKEQRP